MAAAAVLGEGGMFAGEADARFRLMVEVLRIERTKVDVPSFVLDMADLAIPGDIAVDALFLRYPVGHGFVASQAVFRADSLSLGMTFQAVGRPLEEMAMGLGERPGWDELCGLRWLVLERGVQDLRRWSLVIRRSGGKDQE